MLNVISPFLIQITIFVSTFYFTQQNTKADAYIGTWAVHTSNGTFKILLKEIKDYVSDGKKYDVIVGNYTYGNKSTAENQLSSLRKDFVLFGMIRDNGNNTLNMLFDDRINNKSVIVDLTPISSNKNRLRWQVKEELEGLITDSSPPRKKGVSVPTDLILEKMD